MTWRRRTDRIEDEARLDGIYIVRTSLETIETDRAVDVCKNLANVECAYRNSRSDLPLRPIYVYSPAHVRGHVFLCMLSLYVEWHMRQRLAPLLLEDDDRPATRAARKSPVEKARPSPSAHSKAVPRRTADGLPPRSFRTLLDDLSGVVLNQVRLPGHTENLLSVVTTPTPVQARAFQFLGIKPGQHVPKRLPG